MDGRGGDIGLPQGPNASRILANYYLGPIDSQLSQLPEVRYFRYLDDIRICAKTRLAAIKALRVLEREARKRGLTLSSQKTKLLKGFAVAQIDFGDEELSGLAYATEVHPNDPDVERKLNSLLDRAMKGDDKLNKRNATFALYRLFRIRGFQRKSKILKQIEKLAQVIDLVILYLKPTFSSPVVQKALLAFFDNPERNTSEFVSAWLLAGVIDFCPKPIDGIVDYARKIARDRNLPNYHRSLAMAVTAVGKRAHDLAYLHSVVTDDYDPELVRAALVALARTGSLTKAAERSAQRFEISKRAVSYIKGLAQFPSVTGL